jgi:predicted AAA+ superfamily ATPase
MHTITDNDLFHRLAFDNPWWEFKDSTRVAFKNPPKRAFFQAFHQRVMDAGTGNVMVLAGPLRAGKTVLMRQMVAQLVEKGIKPTSILYCSLTTPSYTAADLSILFEMFCRRYRHGPDAEIYIFFDEVQYVKEWEKQLLKLAKMRPHAKIVGAVSSGSPSIVSGAKVMDGKMEIFVLPPLTFLEFMRFRGTEEKLFGTPGGDLQHGAMTLAPNGLPALNQEFHRYVNFGGFLEGILSGKDGVPAPAFIRDGVADRVLHKDLASLSGVNDPQELNRLFGLLAFNTAREVSMDDLAKATGIAKNTLRKYLDYLEQAFLIRRINRVDRDGKKFQRQVFFKVYLTSPSLYAALFAPVPPFDQFFQRLAETALVSQWLGSAAIDNLYYASWRGGAVDLLTLHPETEKPDHVYDLDWSNTYVRTGTRPEQMVNFVRENNPKAMSYVLTGSVARAATMKGVDMTLAPVALYTYWIERDPTLRSFHG